MRLKLIVSLLLVCLAFSFGLAQAQTGEDNTNQNMSQDMSQNMSQQGNMSGNMSNVPFMLKSIEGIRNNDTTGEKWFIYVNGTQAKKEFGLNNVNNGTNLEFLYVNSAGGKVSIENATYVVNVKVNIIHLADNQTDNQTAGNQTEGNQTFTVLYDNTVDLTQGNFTFMPENSTQTYQVANLTDLGALNATGLAFNAALMENMTGNMTQNQNMTQNMSQNMTGASNNDMTNGGNKGGNNNTSTTDDNGNNAGDDNVGGTESM